MAEKEKPREPELNALERVYGALKTLDAPMRRKVLSSVFALLDMTDLPSATERRVERVEPTREEPAETRGTTGRPTSLVELVREKQPSTNGQRIALFAYYRERSEGQPRFARGDLQRYFAIAKLPPSSNYDRDFVETVRKGWIHEDGADSYLTSKGLEAVEAGFPGERKYTKPTAAAGKRGGARKNTKADVKPSAKRGRK
jgi:hypothetical protein